MKHPCIFILYFVFQNVAANAQFTAGSRGLFIKGGHPVNLYGLTLQPTPDLTIADNSLAISNTPIPRNSTQGIKRVYSFASPVNFNGIIGLFYKDDEVNGNTKSSLQITYSSASGGPFTETTGSTSAPAVNYLSNSLSGNIKGITAISPTPLPVTLVRFNVKKEGKTVLLDWSTSTETNSHLFDIQSSTDGYIWKSKGSVLAKGESTKPVRYYFTDTAPFPGQNYYRLKMVDHDGTYAYSLARNVNFPVEDIISVYPNPVIDKAIITVKNWTDVEAIQISDLHGRILYHTQNKIDADLKNGSSVSMGALPAGAYLINVKNKNGTSQSLKVIRQ